MAEGVFCCGMLAYKRCCWGLAGLQPEGPTYWCSRGALLLRLVHLQKGSPRGRRECSSGQGSKALQSAPTLLAWAIWLRCYGWL